MSTAATEPANIRASRFSILIVGGDAHSRNAHAIQLSTHGYDVECAESLEGARQVYAADPPALVLFEVDADSNQAWELQRSIAQENPAQPMGFALSGQQRLCCLTRDGVELAGAQGVDDLVAIVVSLIGSPELGENSARLKSGKKTQ
jgi:CheY-like chemotaxis protein